MRFRVKLRRVLALPAIAGGAVLLLATFPGPVGAAVNGNEVAFQANTGILYAYNSASNGSINTHLGMSRCSNPAIAAGPEIAFETNTNLLYTYLPSNNSHVNTGISMAGCSSPSMVAAPGGGYEIAVASYFNGDLNIYSTLSGADTESDFLVEGETNPSIGISPSGSYNVAFQGTNNHLWIYDSTRHQASDIGCRMDSSSSPSIVTVSSGIYRTAFEGSNEDLWIYSTGGGCTDTGLGMQFGTSPSIATGSEVAFQANTGTLWLYDANNNQSRNVGLGLEESTSPAIAPATGGGYQIAFQANTNILWVNTTGAGPVKTALGMSPNTSPAITN